MINDLPTQEKHLESNYQTKINNTSYILKVLKYWPHGKNGIFIFTWAFQACQIVPKGCQIHHPFGNSAKSLHSRRGALLEQLWFNHILNTSP